MNIVSNDEKKIRAKIKKELEQKQREKELNSEPVGLFVVKNKKGLWGFQNAREKTVVKCELTEEEKNIIVRALTGTCSDSEVAAVFMQTPRILKCIEVQYEYAVSKDITRFQECIEI